MSKKQAKVTADREVRKTKRNLQYQFSDAELLARSRELAEKQIEVRQLEDDQKRVVSGWRARILGVNTEISTPVERRAQRL
ncbi:MAG: hypothetical protein LBK60_03085 [Verrucomicrobiales bacterium]|jgi:hypothetical protein|nr:hypothetical protein [Verrucomicrobiales bacterium]